MKILQASASIKNAESESREASNWSHGSVRRHDARTTEHPDLTCRESHPVRVSGAVNCADAGFGFTLVGDEPIPERRLVRVSTECGVHQVSVVPIALRDRVASPFEECLLRETQHPAGHRNRNLPVGGQLVDQREHHFGSDACDQYAAAGRCGAVSRSPAPATGSVSSLPQFSRVSLGDTGTVTVLDIGDLQPALQTGFRDSEVLRDASDRRLALAGDSDNVATELQGKSY